jgi:malate/lactate dehydrogenase
MLGINGIEKVIELKMTKEEKAALDKSAGDVKKTCDEIDDIISESNGKK